MRRPTASPGVRAAAITIAAAALLAACRTETGPRPTASPSSPASPAPSATLSPAPTGSPVPGTGWVGLWLAVFRVAEVDALNADTQEFIDLVGGAIDVAPVSCFKGLPPRYARRPNAYVLGVIADSRDRLEEVIRSTGREPLFVVWARSICND